MTWSINRSQQFDFASGRSKALRLDPQRKQLRRGFFIYWPGWSNHSLDLGAGG